MINTIHLLVFFELLLNMQITSPIFHRSACLCDVHLPTIYVFLSDHLQIRGAEKTSLLYPPPLIIQILNYKFVMLFSQDIAETIFPKGIFFPVKPFIC